MDLYRNIGRERFQFDFYIESGRQGDYDEEVKKLGGRVFYNTKKKIINIPFFGAFGSFLNEHPEYEIVYAYNQWAGYYLKEAKKRGVKCRIASSRTSVTSGGIKSLIKNSVKKNVGKYATHKFAVSRVAGDWLFGADGGYTVLPNAIDTRKFAFSPSVREEVRKELGLGSGYTVVHVGNIRYPKNHPFLLEVFSEIRKIKADARLVMAGGGDFESLSDKMNGLGISGSVIYLGVRNDIERILQCGDVFVFPSFYEGFPGAVLEAEASGLPCVISDTISDEVILRDSAAALSLSSGAREWAERAVGLAAGDRQTAWKDIADAGYDIHRLVKTTEEFFAGVSDS